MTERYTVIESKCWNHTSGRNASIYGALPWYNESDAKEWTMVTRGWTIRDNYQNTIGLGRVPFTSLDDAIALCNKLNTEHTNYFASI